MNKKLLKKLVAASYKSDELDEEKIRQIAAKLSRKELKEYVKALRASQQKRTVHIESAFVLSEKAQDRLKGLFPHKKAIFTQNKDLISGLKIQDNDVLYDFNVKDALERVATYAAEIS